MNRNDFMEKLKENLVKYKLSNQDIKEILDDFNDHIQQSMLYGKTEEEIVETLGNPFQIAEEYKSIQAIRDVIKNPTGHSFIKLVIHCIGSGVGGLVYLLFALFGEFLILLGSFQILTIGLVGVICIIGLFIPYIRNNWVLIGLETNLLAKLLIMLLLGITLCFSSYKFVKQINHVNKKYCIKVAMKMKQYVYHITAIQ